MSNAEFLYVYVLFRDLTVETGREREIEKKKKASRSTYWQLKKNGFSNFNTGLSSGA